MQSKIIYIPTMTTKMRYNKNINSRNILYSPNKQLPEVFKAEEITIWDNYTFYWLCKYHKADKHEKAREHYLWLIYFIKNNYQDGITLITPDVEWLKYKEEIEEKWYTNCKDYPQLYVPNTWKDTKDLNIIGYALRTNTPTSIKHPKWNHCLRHIREIECEKLTYDSIVKRT